jgi:hypothetical protein
MGETTKSHELTLDQFPFVEVESLKKAPFCVDGRAGKVGESAYGVYPQMLGGSLMPVVLEWLMKKPQENLTNVLTDVFGRLKEFGYPLGVHTSTHANEEKSDCGFADNLGNILKVFRENSGEIRGILTEVDVNFEDSLWSRVEGILERIDLEKLPKGKESIKKAEENGAILQTLDGGHQETAAVVNLVPGSTLDVDRNQSHQAFNLDLWLVEEIGQKFGWDNNLTSALSLGLYVATEMVLVEAKGKPRLPILVRSQAG